MNTNCFLTAVVVTSVAFFASPTAMNAQDIPPVGDSDATIDEARVLLSDLMGSASLVERASDSSSRLRSSWKSLGEKWYDWQQRQVGQVESARSVSPLHHQQLSHGAIIFPGENLDRFIAKDQGSRRDSPAAESEVNPIVVAKPIVDDAIKPAGAVEAISPTTAPLEAVKPVERPSGNIITAIIEQWLKGSSREQLRQDVDRMRDDIERLKVELQNVSAQLSP